MHQSTHTTLLKAHWVNTKTYGTNKQEAFLVNALEYIGVGFWEKGKSGIKLVEYTSYGQG